MVSPAPGAMAGFVIVAEGGPQNVSPNVGTPPPAAENVSAAFGCDQSALAKPATSYAPVASAFVTIEPPFDFAVIAPASGPAGFFGAPLGQVTATHAVPTDSCVHPGSVVGFAAANDAVSVVTTPPAVSVCFATTAPNFPVGAHSPRPLKSAWSSHMTNVPPPVPVTTTPPVPPLAPTTPAAPLDPALAPPLPALAPPLPAPVLMPPEPATLAPPTPLPL